MTGSAPPPEPPSRVRRWALPAVLVAVAGCGSGVLDPQGRNADRIATLTIVMIGLGAAVFLLVVGLLVVALRRQRQDLASTRLIVAGGIVLPAVVLSGLVGAAVWAGDELSRRGEEPLVIEITGHQFWWDVRYPGAEVRTANELHLPVGEPVELRLTSADVIHSFWVPQLAGKIDLIPGRTNQLTVEIDRAGRLSGYCAEFCGIQHANMRIDAVGHEPDDFAAWLEEQAAPAEVHTDGPLLEGQEAFLGSSCVYCHAVEGTNASSEFGPDLTHLMSRRSIGAGALPNTRGHLAGWILDPQEHKPGNRMPPTELSPEELLALLDYLETLE